MSFAALREGEASGIDGLGLFARQNEIHSSSGQTPNNDFTEGLSLGLTQSLAQTPMCRKAEGTEAGVENAISNIQPGGRLWVGGARLPCR